MNTLDFYETYGESLATRLAAIGHTADNKRFVLVEDGASPEEVIQATTSTLPAGVNVLIWETFSEGISNGRTDNYHSRLQGSLAVIRKDGTDRVSRRTAKRTSRTIALKVVALMLKDSLEGILSEESISLKFDNLDGDKIDLGNGWAGWGYSFDWTAPLDLTLLPGDLVG